MQRVLEESEPLLASSRRNGPARPAGGWRSRFKNFFSSITVEPALLLYMLAYGLCFVYTTQIWVEKVCYFHFHYDEEICKNLDTGKYPEEQSAVHRMTTRYNVYNHLIEYLPAALIVLVLGAWSDTRDRRLPIIIPMVGIAIMKLGLAANAYWWTLLPDYILLAYVPVGLTGAAMTIFMGGYAYVAVASGQRARTSRISMIGVVSVLGATVGQVLGLLVYASWGYVGVFLVGALLLGVAAVYGLARLEKKPGTSDEAELRQDRPIREILSLAQLKETLLTPFRRRRDQGRCHVIGHIVVILLFLSTYGSLNYNFLYTRIRFSWDYKNFTKWSITDTCLLSLGPLVIVPVMSYLWQVEDSLIGFLGGVSLLFCYVLRATAYVDWILYLASVIGLGQGLIVMASRGAISKTVTEEETAKIFAVLGAFEAGVPALSALVYTAIYNNFLETFPGAIYVFTAFIAVVICCLYVSMCGRQPTERRDENGP
ncbi:probable peptidoglycan muropeptide transporter SLC46 [Penaeus indicus]|uniref:probable peptidoglycan muropeptide transporter SLC46 n=1 Tax=Penaeus indicus TaxID=29960 RepID=UPI00300C1BB0